MFVWLSDLKWMFLELRWLQDISTYTLIYWHSHIMYNIQEPLILLHILYSYKHTHTYTHLLPLLPQRQDMNVSVPPQQFSFNGPPDNHLFSSVLLVWPLAQSLPQLSTKTQDLSPLSGGGSCKEEIIWARFFFGYHLNLELSPDFSVLFKFDSTQFCIWLYWQTKLSWQQSPVWSDEVFSCCFWLLLSLKPEVVLFSGSLLYSSYLLIAMFCFLSAVLTDPAGCWFK